MKTSSILLAGPTTACQLATPASGRDKTLAQLRIDTVTAGDSAKPSEIEILSWSWRQTGLPAPEGGSMDLAAVNILRSR